MPSKKASGPENIQGNVTAEIFSKKMLNRGTIEKGNFCSEKTSFNHCKREASIQLALDSKFSLIQLISNNLSALTERDQADFRTLDLQYICSQFNIHPGTARCYNFNKLIRAITGTYRFKTGFHALTDIAAEFQRAIDNTTIGFANTNCFSNDLLILCSGSSNDYKNPVRNCLKKLFVKK